MVKVLPKNKNSFVRPKKSRFLQLGPLVTVAFAILFAAFYITKPTSLERPKEAAEKNNYYLKINVKDGKVTDKYLLTNLDEINNKSDVKIQSDYQLKNKSTNQTIESVLTIPNKIDLETFSKNKPNMTIDNGLISYYKLPASSFDNNQVLQLQSKSEVSITSASENLINLTALKKQKFGQKVEGQESLAPVFLHRNTENRLQDHTLDIVITDNGYGTEHHDEFVQYAEFNKNSLLGSHFFSENKNRINVIRYDSYSTLQNEGITNSSEECKKGNRIIDACFEEYKLSNILARANGDILVLLVKDDPSIEEYGAQYQYLNDNFIAISDKIYDEPDLKGISIISHELGHTTILGNLSDEYTNTDSIPPTNKPNCNKQGVFPNGKRFKGCKVDDYYRSSQNSIMRASQNDMLSGGRFVPEAYTFNEISYYYLEKGLNNFAPKTLDKKSADLKLPTPGESISFPVEFGWLKPNPPDAYVTLVISSTRGQLYTSGNIIQPGQFKLTVSNYQDKPIINEDIKISLVTNFNDGSPILTQYYNYKVVTSNNCKGGNCSPLTSDARLINPTSDKLPIPSRIQWVGSLNPNANYHVIINNSRGVFVNKRAPAGSTSMDINISDLTLNKPLSTNERITLELRTYIPGGSPLTNKYNFTSAGNYSNSTSSGNPVITPIITPNQPITLDKLQWCAADTNRDNTINIVDVVYTSSKYNQQVCNKCKGNPAGNDNVINILDTTLISGLIGQKPPFNTSITGACGAY